MKIFSELISKVKKKRDRLLYERIINDPHIDQNYLKFKEAMREYQKSNEDDEDEQSNV